jgi:hypothetical protein
VDQGQDQSRRPEFLLLDQGLEAYVELHSKRRNRKPKVEASRATSLNA